MLVLPVVDLLLVGGDGTQWDADQELVAPVVERVGLEPTTQGL
jgi:hypothetical protein